ncbi:hypothetical protein K239x_35040 [Planctomycetes bacterium K23_9]|uniref:Uncharacterized protein n=1 Tax=Stieleria marina TaxID=1930275 RepID=A0A517NWN9_9BACT|nr:hypothetical protein K239x_35040 [Planctomycetes bacterium K23_9]
MVDTLFIFARTWTNFPHVKLRLGRASRHGNRRTFSDYTPSIFTFGSPDFTVLVITAERRFYFVGTGAIRTLTGVGRVLLSIACDFHDGPPNATDAHDT